MSLKNDKFNLYNIKEELPAEQNVVNRIEKQNIKSVK